MSGGRYWFPKPYADVVARLRVPSGFLLVLAFAVFARPTLESLLISLPVSLLGLWLRGWAAGHLDKNRSLTVSGPYAYLRNPLYLGTLLVALGLAVAARQWALGALFIGVFLLVYLPVMELEEQHLRKLFPAYAEYADRVPLLVARGRRYPPDRPFAWSLYRRNEEYQALFGYLGGLVFLAVRAFWGT